MWRTTSSFKELCIVAWGEMKNSVWNQHNGIFGTQLCLWWITESIPLLGPWSSICNPANICDMHGFPRLFCLCGSEGSKYCVWTIDKSFRECIFKCIFLNENLRILVLISPSLFQLKINQHWFRIWLGTGQAPSHYLYQWRYSSPTHMCACRPQWDKTQCPGDAYICRQTKPASVLIITCHQLDTNPLHKPMLVYC